MRGWFALLAALVLACALPLPAQTADDPGKAIVVQARGVTFESAASDRVRLRVTLVVTSRRDLRLRDLRLERLRANGAPFHASPAPGELELPAGQAVELPLTMTIYLRELDSVEPLKRAIDEQKVTLSGVIYGEIVVGRAAKLLLMTRRVRAAVPVEQEAAFSLPGGGLGRMLVAAMLDKAEEGLRQSGGLWRKAHDELSSARRAAHDAYAPRLALVRTSFRLAGEPAFERFTTGLRMSGCRMLVSRAALEPWLFEPEAALAHRRAARQAEQSLDVAVWPMGTKLRDSAGALDFAQAWRLSQKQLRLPPAPKSETESFYTLLGHDKVKISLAAREGASALAAVEITAPGCNDASLAAPPAYDLRDAQPSGENYASFHFNVLAATAEPELTLSPLEQPRRMSELPEPVSSVDWGSPVVSDKGLAGFVVDERRAAPLVDLLADPKLLLPPAPTQQRAAE